MDSSNLPPLSDRKPNKRFNSIDQGAYDKIKTENSNINHKYQKVK